jgi:glucose-1-phosphate cytidylyltransferase
MKVVILAGGLGSRLAEETELKPKPMVEIGGRPILWHIMKYYSHFGFNEFYIALGYKGEIIKNFFLNYHSLSRSLTVHLRDGATSYLDGESENWNVHLIDTGLNTQTGGRVKRLARWIGNEPFMMTYGDGLCDVDLQKLIEFHKCSGRIATITAVRPPARFGALQIDGDQMVRFAEKSQIDEGWINGGFLVFQPDVFEYLRGDESSLESEALEELSRQGQLAAYTHEGFWHCMDTLREKRSLERLWSDANPPWKVWS